MKKLFYAVAVVATMLFTACGNKSEQTNNDVPEEIAAFIASANEELGGLSEEGMTYQGTKLEGKDIVVLIDVDESIFYGMDLKTAFNMSGMTEEAFAQYMKAEMFRGMDEEDRQQAAALREYEYNIVIRLTGSKSKEEMNCRINYNELPR